DVDLVLLAMGFLGPERRGVVEELGLKLTERGNVWRDASWMTSVPGVFTCGDMQRGQSLIVWAIAEGRSAARGVDIYLIGKSDLPAPLPDLPCRWRGGARSRVRHVTIPRRPRHADPTIRRRPRAPPRRVHRRTAGGATVAARARRMVGPRGRRPLRGLRDAVGV